MDERIVNEINRLKDKISKQKESIPTINDLVNKTIDRPFHTNPWELSEKELDNEMGNILPFLNDDIDPEQSKQVITSHRNFLGKPILYLKHKFLNMFQFYTSFLLNKQRSFNDKLVAYQLSSFIRFRQNEKHIKAIEEKLKEIEENQELLMDQLKNLTNNNNTKKKGNG